MFNLKLDLPESNESVADYVARVGSAFAIAMYRFEQQKLDKQMQRLETAKERMLEALDDHFGSALDDEDEFEYAFGEGLNKLQLNHQFWKAQEDAVWVLPFAKGTEPGKQEDLSGNGCNISLKDITFECIRGGLK